MASLMRSSLRQLYIQFPKPVRRCYSSFQNNDSSEPKTHFGFKDVPESAKAKLVGEVFHNVAGKYDLMNDVMSGGVHRLWKDYFISKLDPQPGTKLLDVAGGTGDIAFRFLNYANEVGRARRLGRHFTKATAIVCDINPSMIQVGKDRAMQKEIDGSALSWVVGDAEQLPLRDECVDAYTIAFGIRNVTHIDRALKEAHRVLKKGGRFMCLEFSHVSNPLVRGVYDAYSFEAIPRFGEFFASDRDSYQYLVESIRKFPKQEDFCRMIETAGFEYVTYENLTFGVAAIHSGFKL
eukprot:Colp12_sorted_trinity150504_noHs@20754